MYRYLLMKSRHTSAVMMVANSDDSQIISKIENLKLSPRGCGGSPKNVVLAR